MNQFLIKNAHLVDPQVSLDEQGDVLIENDTIVAVGSATQEHDTSHAQVIDASGKVLVPGLVDIHVHFRDPGFEYKEDIVSGSRAALKGGFSDVCCMANTDPVIDNAAVLRAVMSKAHHQAFCKVHAAGACTKGLKGEALADIGEMSALGAVAFTDDGHGVQSSSMMRRVMDYAHPFNKVIMSHCQDEDLVDAGQINEGAVSTRLGLLGWPAAGEEIQISRDMQLAQLTQTPLHIQHLTSAAGVEQLRAAKAQGVPVTCEVTPHHLFLHDSDIDESYNTNFKVNPPLRTQADSDALVQGLLDGTIDCIVTDHAPHAAYEKAREFELAPFGMIGLETSLALMITHLVASGKLSWSQLVSLMAVNPRAILRLDPVRIAPQSRASLTLIDPNASWDVTEQEFESKSSNSAFLGAHLQGRACDVFIDGKHMLIDGALAHQPLSQQQ